MQRSHPSFTTPSPDWASSSQDSARRKKSSVTFPPISTASGEHRGSSAPSGAPKSAGPQPSILSPRPNPAWETESTNPAAAVAARATTAAATLPGVEYSADQDKTLARHRYPASDLSTSSEEHRQARPPRTARKPLPRQLSRLSSELSTNSSSTGRTASVRSGSRTTKTRASAPAPAVALQQLLPRAEDDEAVADALLRDGNTGEALQVLRKTIDAMHALTTAANARSDGKRKGPGAGPAPLSRTASLSSASSASASAAAADTMERLAVAYTSAANNAAVQCGVTAEPLTVQKAYFQAAMRYLVQSEEEVLFAEWKRPQRPSSVRSASARPTGAAKPEIKTNNSSISATTTFSVDDNGSAASATLCQLLRCAVRNNAAVCLADRSTRGGQARVIYELLKALVDCRGVWGAVVLYNLAVSFLGVEHYDDAAEAIARCMELAYHYVKLSEEYMSDRDGTCEEAAAVAALHRIMTLQLIRGHHFIATMAAWCDPAGALEVQHCEMAAGCARQYLHAADGKQAECRRRLLAAEARARVGGMRSTRALTTSPPTLPYMTQDTFLPCAVTASGTGEAAAATLSERGVAMKEIVLLLTLLADFPSAAAATAPLALTLPAEVRSYVQAVQKGGALRFWCEEAQHGGAAAPFLLTAAKAVGPLPTAIRPRTDADGSGSAEALALPPRTSSTARKKSRLSTTAAEQHRTSPTPSAQTEQSGTAAASPADHQLHHPSKPAPYFVTTLPQSTFHRYRSLRASVVTQLESAEGQASKEAGVEENPVAEAEATAPASRGRRMTALLYGATAASTNSTTASPAHPHAPEENKNGCEVASAHEADEKSNVLVVPVRPSELLRQLDTETETCYSRLVADPLADVHRGAATRLQLWWKSQRARRERERRAAAVARRCLQDAQAYRIQNVFRDWRRRQRRVAEREAQYQARYREEQVSVMQAFLRHRQSLELWGRACVAQYGDLLRHRQDHRRYDDAAVKLQSWWRMCAVQADVRATLKAASLLQACWRGALVRARVRKAHVHRRLAEEAWRQQHTQHAVRLQRWWRWWATCRDARAVLKSRREAVEAHVLESASAHEDAMTAYARDPSDAVAAMRLVLAVLAGARDRRCLATLHHYAQVRTRAVERYVLTMRSHAVLAALRDERRERLRVERRREEVDVATRRLQAWVRRWLPQRQLARRGDGHMMRRHHAASRIQATWRMHHTRGQLKEFSRFMARDRHMYAARIQRAWRAHCDQRCRCAPTAAAAVSAESNAPSSPTGEQVAMAAQRIQTWFRMHRARVKQRAKGVRQLREQRTRDVAARRIQLWWRTCAITSAAAWTELDELTLLRQRHTASALDAYTSWVQAFVRSAVSQRMAFARRTAQTPIRSPLSFSLRRGQVPQPPTVIVKGASNGSSTSVAAEADKELGPLQCRDNSPATTPTFRHVTPRLPGFHHTGSLPKASSSSTTPETADLARPSPSCSALPHSFSRLTGSTDRPLYFFCSDSTCEHHETDRTHCPSTTTSSSYSYYTDSDDGGGSAGVEAGADAARRGTVQQSPGDVAEEVLSPGSANLLSNTRGEEQPEDATAPTAVLATAAAPAAGGVVTPTVPVTPSFPIPRPPVPQRTMCTVRCRHTPEEVAAATFIQAVWRGYRARCNIEYYYEEYYEEVDEEFEQEEEGDVDFDDDEEEDEDDA